MRRFVFPGGTAVVTGAASGIGEALAHGLARRGSNLVLVDRAAERLDGVAAALRQAHPDLTVETHVADLSDLARAQGVAEEIRRAHPRVRLLVNNAGVALGGRFDQVTLEEFNWVVDINFRAVVTITHTLLPSLTAEPGSHLVNLSSVFGLVAPIGQSAYAASKFAVRGLTECLRGELADLDVGVTVVYPGGIRTRIAESARTAGAMSAQESAAWRVAGAKPLTIEPAQAAQAILAGVERRRGRVLIGWSSKFPDVLARTLPAGYGRILNAAIRKEAASAGPTP